MRWGSGNEVFVFKVREKHRQYRTVFSDVTAIRTALLIQQRDLIIFNLFKKQIKKVEINGMILYTNR